MKSFLEVTREFYIGEGMSYKEASHHATADNDMWRKIFMGMDNVVKEDADDGTLPDTG